MKFYWHFIFIFEAPRTFSIAQSETFLMRMHTIANEELDFMMLRRMSQDSSLCATEAELIQRLQRITVLTTNRFMYQGNNIFQHFYEN